MTLSSIPYSFIREHVFLLWSDTLWGYEHQLIGWCDIVAIAMDRLLLGSDNPIEINLAGLGKSDTSQIGELLRILANGESGQIENTSERKWLFLVLLWLFENKDSISDPLAEIELIYANFGYPSEIEGFVGYMPVTDGYDPSQHSIEENRARLFLKWEQYLYEEMKAIGVSRAC